MTRWTQRHTLFALLSATVLAALFAPSAEDEAVMPARTTPPVQPGVLSASAPASGAGQVLALRPRDDGEIDPASVLVPKPGQLIPRPAAPPPTVPVVETPASPPVDEPPVVRVLGRYGGSGAQAALLQYQQETLVVRVGDTVADTWRVDGILDGVITLVHRDTGRKHTLSFENK